MKTKPKNMYCNAKHVKMQKKSAKSQNLQHHRVNFAQLLHFCQTEVFPANFGKPPIALFIASHATFPFLLPLFKAAKIYQTLTERKRTRGVPTFAKLKCVCVCECANACEIKLYRTAIESPLGSGQAALWVVCVLQIAIV